MAGLLKKHLRPEAIVVPMRATTKDEAIVELIEALARADGIPDPKPLIDAVRERERAMSTGMENGIAIPHGKTDAVAGMHVGFGIQPKGIAFDSMDGEPARLFIVTLSPKGKRGPHIRFMAEVSNLLQAQKLRDRLLKCSSNFEAYDVLTR